MTTHANSNKYPTYWFALLGICYIIYTVMDYHDEDLFLLLSHSIDILLTIGELDNIIDGKHYRWKTLQLFHWSSLHTGWHQDPGEGGEVVPWVFREAVHIHKRSLTLNQDQAMRSPHSAPTPVTCSGHMTSHYHRKRPCDMVETSGNASN